MERFQNIKTGINNARYIKLIFPENPNSDTLAAVLALNSMFRQMNKKVFLPLDRLPQKIRHFLDAQKKKITITLNEEVDEIYYEKKGNHVDLNIVPKNSNFDTKNFSWEIVSEKAEEKQELSETPDLIIILGVPRFSDVEKFLPTDEEELFACTIVNIDKNQANENYGDINIIDQGLLSKTISFLIKEMKENSFKKEIFDFLLFGFFSQKRVSPKDVSAIKWIVNNMGSLDMYFEYQKEEKPIWAHYLEAVIRNISMQENEGIIFSYLPNKENQKEDEAAKNILHVSKIFKDWINPEAFFISFKDEDKTKTIFYSSLPTLINKIRLKHVGSFKETGGIIINSRNDPREAMEELKEINF